MADSDGLVRVFAIHPDEPWQQKYGGLYGGVFACELDVKLYALRLLTDRDFEAADAAAFEAEYGLPLPPIPEEVRAARTERLRKEIAYLQAAADAPRLPAGGAETAAELLNREDRHAK